MKMDMGIFVEKYRTMSKYIPKKNRGTPIIYIARKKVSRMSKKTTFLYVDLVKTTSVKI